MDAVLASHFRNQRYSAAMLKDPSLNANRCPACRLVRPLCVCSLAPRRLLQTDVRLVIHASEWNKSSNTGHLLSLAARGPQVLLHGVKDAPLPPPAAQAEGEGSVLALFPGCGARALTPERCAALKRPIRLYVPDGNWTQARSMMMRLPLLQKAQAVELPGPTLAMTRPRRNLFPGRMSTFEAVAQALGLLEGTEVEDELLEFFQIVVSRMMMLRGKIRGSEVYGGLPWAPTAKA